MAATPGAADPHLEQELLTQSHRFSFSQVLRLVRLLAEHDGAGKAPVPVRVRPKLDLAFPAADVSAIEKTEEGVAVEASFFGLYGPSSPLPTFYSEELLDESARDASAARDLFDLLHQHLFDQYDRCATKYRLLSGLADSPAQAHSPDRLFCLIGLDHTSLQVDRPELLLRYAGLLVQFPRSAAGLQALVADALRVPVRIVQGVRRLVQIPVERQLQLGVSHSTAGEDALLGTCLPDLNGKFRIQLGPLEREEYDALLPGAPQRRLLDGLVEVFLTAPLTWDLELIPAHGGAPAAVLGTSGRLGWDCFLAPASCSHNISAVFPR